MRRKEVDYTVEHGVLVDKKHTIYTTKPAVIVDREKGTLYKVGDVGTTSVVTSPD